MQIVSAGARVGRASDPVPNTKLIKRGRRVIAVHTLSLTDRIAAQSHKCGPRWSDYESTSRYARVIRNYT